MLRNVLRRSVFYDPKRQWRVPHSDNRDVYHFVGARESNGDSEYALALMRSRLKESGLSWMLILGFVGYTLYSSRWMRRYFDIRYLHQLPSRDFDRGDYDYKFWEAALAVPDPKYGASISTDSICSDSYVLLYLGSVGGDHIPMQRFSRVQRFISSRKNLPLKSVFLCLDEDCDPETLYHYVSSYSPQTTAAFLPSSESIAKMHDIFQNIGCIYVLEKHSGNVVFIIDPNKHPLESLGNKITFNISKCEDLRISRDIVVSKKDVRIGHENVLEYKPPTY